MYIRFRIHLWVWKMWFLGYIYWSKGPDGKLVLTSRGAKLDPSQLQLRFKRR